MRERERASGPGVGDERRRRRRRQQEEDRSRHEQDDAIDAVGVEHFGATESDEFQLVLVGVHSLCDDAQGSASGNWAEQGVGV